MLQRKVNGLRRISFLTVMIILIGSVSNSLGQGNVDQNYERGQKKIHITQEEMLRYSSIHSAMLEKAVNLFANEPGFEELMAEWGNEEKSGPAMSDSALADNEPISLESARRTAYAALEKEFGFSADDFLNFYPTCVVYGTDSTAILWFQFLPYQDVDSEIIYNYHVQIYSDCGDIALIAKYISVG